MKNNSFSTYTPSVRFVQLIIDIATEVLEMPPNVLVGVEQRAEETVQTLFEYIQSQGPRDYGGRHDDGECVSQLEHSLQAGYLAKKAGADDETVLAALLHDIGHFIPMYAEMPMLIAPNGSRVGRKSHDHFGETYLRELGFSDKICQLVGAHVMAKRYLTAIDKSYYDTLSEVSKNSLQLQVCHPSLLLLF